MTDEAAVHPLTAASHAALSGPNAEDPWPVWDLTLQESLNFIVAWTEELRDLSAQQNEPTEGQAFELRLAAGLLATGIVYGLDLARRRVAGSV